MRKLVGPLTLSVILLALAAGGAAADASTASVQPSDLEAAIFGAGSPTPLPAAKPPKETCPGQFDISRLASWEECTLAACNQWCVEEGASYAAYEVWISWGICACRCCP